MKIVVLASGRGSNFAAICDAAQRGEIPGVDIRALICNVPQAPALVLARDRRVPAETVDSKSFGRGAGFDRAQYERVLLERIRSFSPDLICLAGYQLLLGAVLVGEWTHRMVNIHPSLLPSFKGLHAQRQALTYGVRWTGCTVHFVTEELDNGPILLQSAIEILDDDTEDSLVQRLLPIEHATYVEVLRRLATRKYEIIGRRVVWN